MNREVCLVLGKTGFGKSLWSKIYLQGYQRKLVFDPMMTVETFYMKGEDLAAEVTENLDAYQRAPSFSFGIYEPSDVPIIGALAYAVGNNLLLLEECAMIWDKGTRQLEPWCHRLVFTGRHQRASLLLIAQRPVSIPIDFRSQANRVVTFQQHEGGDMGWLVDFFGRERVEEMPTLPKFECFDYHNGQITRYNIRSLVESRLGIKLDKEPVEVYDNGGLMND